MRFRFLNLMWAMSAGGFRQYELAARLKMSESRFSRCLHGRRKFSKSERAHLAGFLGYPEAWLFREVKPPEREMLIMKSTAESVV